MKSSFVLFPNDLKAEHDRVNDMSRNDVSQAYDRRIAKMFEGWQHRYGYNKMGFVVIPPHSAKEITQEGDKLHHCVGRYVRDVVKSDTTILFIRKASAPKKPYCTVEVKHGDVVQARIQNNNAPPPKVKSAVIRMTRNEATSCGCDERLLRRVVKTTFNQRRKMMRGSLKPLFAQLDQEQGRTVGGHADFLAQPLLTKRPEQLSVQDFIDLTNAVEREMKG